MSEATPTNPREGEAATQESVHRRLAFFDADCVIGPRYAPMLPDGSDWSAASLLRKMDELGIAEACPASSLAAEYGLEEGNRWLVEAVAGQPRLHPVWDVAAHHTGEFPPPALLITQLRQHGVRMVRLLLHAANGYLGPLHVPVHAELFDGLAEARLPLVLGYTTFGEDDFPALRELLAGWPQLPVLISFPKLEHEERLLYYLWECHSNLHVTLSGYQLLGGIEKIVRRFGARVLIYGSHYPFFTPLQSMLQLIYSEIGEADQRRIAGGNLRDLLRGEAPK